MFTVENRRGRLIEVRMTSPTTMQEIDDSDGKMEKVLQAISGDGVVAADYAHARILPSAQAKRLAEIFRRHTPRVERSGILIAADSAVALLQMERMIHLAQNPGRKVFREVHELKAWLDELLTPLEKARLRAFFEAPRT